MWACGLCLGLTYILWLWVAPLVVQVPRGVRIPRRARQPAGALGDELFPEHPAAYRQHHEAVAGVPGGREGARRARVRKFDPIQA